MDFGKLPSVDRVDFRLPPDPACNARVLDGATRSEPAIDVGTAGWSDKRFVGKLYPDGTRPGDFLAHYARAFSCNELNATYYGVDARRIETWSKTVPDGFRFCPKLPAGVTHERELRGVEREMEGFARALESFGDRLGRAWGVLPPAFGPGRVDELARFVEAWAARLPLALELRHPAWFAGGATAEEGFELLERHGVPLILTDVAGRRDVVHMRLTARDALVRFVGNALHPSDFTRLDAWVERLGAWFDAGLEHAWFFLHQPDDHQTVELAEHLLPRLGARLGVDLSAWRREAPPPPGAQQLGLFS